MICLNRLPSIHAFNVFPCGSVNSKLDHPPRAFVGHWHFLFGQLQMADMDSFDTYKSPTVRLRNMCKCPNHGKNQNSKELKIKLGSKMPITAGRKHYNPPRSKGQYHRREQIHNCDLKAQFSLKSYWGSFIL